MIILCQVVEWGGADMPSPNPSGLGTGASGEKDNMECGV